MASTPADPAACLSLPADEPSPSDDLMAFYNLRRLYDYTQSAMQPADYLAGVPTDARLYAAPDAGLATVPRSVGSAQAAPRPPLAPARVRAAVALAPGRWSVPDGVRGEPVKNAMRVRHASVLLAAAAAAAALAPASADAPPPPPAPIATWTGVSFDGAVAALPASSPVVLEFFAHWCPACQRFAPVYEAAAAAMDGGVTVARVDCADDAALCNRFGVRSYPTVHFAAASKLAAVKGAKDARGLATYGGAHDAAALAAWAKDEVAKMSGGDSDSAAAAAKPAVTADTAALPAASMDISDLEKATVLTFEYALAADAALAEPGARAALRAFTALVATAHPIPACAAGAGTLLATLERDWPVAAAADAAPPAAALAALRSVHVCGPSPPPTAWRACAPSPQHTGRGYTCGLWTLFHALAVGAGDGAAAGRTWLDAVAGWVAHFFACSECASHFASMVAAPDARAVASGRDGRLWAWRAHNAVNARLAADEAASNTADPTAPKLQWPPRALCPACAAPAPGAGGAPQWDEGAVDSFLISFYGGSDRAARAAAAAAHLGRRGLDRGAGRRAAGGGAPVVGVIVFGVVAAGAAWGARAGRGVRSKEKH